MSETVIIPFKNKGQKGSQGSYSFKILCSFQRGNNFEIKEALGRVEH